MALKESLAGWARRLKAQTEVLAVAVRHPRVPWPAKIFGAVVIAYALSPIDLIPDFIPILGYLDDLVLVPRGPWLTLKLIPAKVLAEVRKEACEARGLPILRRVSGGGTVVQGPGVLNYAVVMRPARSAACSATRRASSLSAHVLQARYHGGSATPSWVIAGCMMRRWRCGSKRTSPNRSQRGWGCAQRCVRWSSRRMPSASHCRIRV